VPVRFRQEVQAVSRQARLRIHVAAGILENGHGDVLLAERLCDGPFHGLWEFPGGKIQDDESAEVGLKRELQEELGIEVIDSEPYLRLSHDYEDRSVDLEFFRVKRWRGEPAGLEGQKLRWANVEQLNADELLPADAPLLESLRQGN